MKLVFVAGPYRAPSEWDITENIRKAEKVALALWRMGASVICPQKNTANFGGAAPDSVWLNGAQEMVRRSDGVMTVNGWEDSEGARAEVDLAKSLGLPVFATLEEVSEWLQSPE